MDAAPINTSNMFFQLVNLKFNSLGRRENLVSEIGYMLK